MAGGRPPKPVEQKRLAGNPGKRPLPEPISILPVQAHTIPKAPRGLGPAGRRCWRRIWALGRAWISETSDLDIATRLAEAHDERQSLRETIAEQGYFTTGSQGQVVSHPAVAQIRALEQLMTRYESLCGLTPSDRSRLGVAEVTRMSKLDDFLSRRREA
jgi:P27 family predicted phage terminase small subunit